IRRTADDLAFRAHHRDAGAHVEIALLEQNVRIRGATREAACVGRSSAKKRKRRCSSKRRETLFIHEFLSPKVRNCQLDSIPPGDARSMFMVYKYEKSLRHRTVLATSFQKG